jgi:hypothetical protein
MTVFTWKKEDLKNILKDINGVEEEKCCTKKIIIEDLQSILATMDMTRQKNIYAVTRGNLVYLTGRNPESI